MLDRRLLAPHAVARWAVDTPDAIAIQHVDGDGLTYRQLHEDALRWADGFRRLGIGPETHVATMLPNDFTSHLSMLGLGALLAASATLFTILKWVGAAYLVYLGIKLWRAGGALEAAPRTDAVSAARMLGHAWLVTALNPKSITFFVAFLPAFLDPHADFLTQMLVFETTFLLLAFGNAFGYALVASRARGFVSNPRAIGIINKVGGSLLIGAGAATVTLAGSRS